jgi:hypothetical protein
MKLIVSFGGGVNSAAMLVGLHERRIVPDAILFADTGGEKPETYEFIDLMRTWAVRNMDCGIVALANDGMYETLENECLKKHTLPSLVFGWRSCSDKYKLRPQQKYVKRAFPDEEIRWAVGIDAGETHRRKGFDNCWHPLIEWGWDREACIGALKRNALPVPTKSACFFCPASTKSEVKHLAAVHPDLFKRAVEMEENTKGLRVSGLGRHWNWQELVQISDQQMSLLPEAPQIACMCFDGEE